MATFTKIALSGASNGLGIKIAATSSSGTLIHTAVTGTSDWDEIWLWVVNTSASDVLLTLQYGGTTSPDNDLSYTVATKDGLKCVLPGMILQNSLVLRGYAASANVLVAYGFVNRITA